MLNVLHLTYNLDGGRRILSRTYFGWKLVYLVTLHVINPKRWDRNAGTLANPDRPIAAFLGALRLRCRLIIILGLCHHNIFIKSVAN